ncbi:DUF4381 domain-containing protein [Legionella septentrionalis]|uniref:DUF4381 domain-containing protein n=1 Tax=Legionella septentrionalis TaxID=2498109 RepID=UPI000F8EA2B3|nr:DUF4381 domain-containing protein [Legionella septentrionalis]RUR09548.1 DUF4381 domain-containing protein [Legionella septentrionalis]RUR16349.1 DUF4381 domain-containing protein [Legionella septentrionalis]
MAKRFSLRWFYIFAGFLPWPAGFAASPPPQQELAHLRDIHIPPAIGWWPLAPGWYVILCLLAVALFALAFFLYRHYKRGRAKRHALRILKTYRLEYAQQGNAQITCARISELLKRVALVYFPREQVASLQGEDWINFLDKTGRGIDFQPLKMELLELPFQPDNRTQAPPQNKLPKQQSGKLPLLFMQTEKWIKQRSKPCLN